MTKTRYSVLF